MSEANVDSQVQVEDIEDQDTDIVIARVKSTWMATGMEFPDKAST
jgi:hypothetical protein